MGSKNKLKKTTKKFEKSLKNRLTNANTYAIICRLALRELRLFSQDKLFRKLEK